MHRRFDACNNVIFCTVAAHSTGGPAGGCAPIPGKPPLTAVTELGGSWPTSSTTSVDAWTIKSSASTLSLTTRSLPDGRGMVHSLGSSIPWRGSRQYGSKCHHLPTRGSLSLWRRPSSPSLRHNRIIVLSGSSSLLSSSLLLVEPWHVHSRPAPAVSTRDIVGLQHRGSTSTWWTWVASELGDQSFSSLLNQLSSTPNKSESHRDTSEWTYKRVICNISLCQFV